MNYMPLAPEGNKIPSEDEISSYNDHPFSPEDHCEKCLNLYARMKEDLKYLIHEIRTPLTAVAGSAEFLHENRVSEEQQKAWLSAIQRETMRINALLDDFLRVRTGPWISSLNRTEIIVCELLEDAADRFSGICEKHPIQTLCPPDLLPVYADRAKLGQVLRNLIANAVKYSPEGGAIHLTAGRQDTWTIISVRDEGPGIPQEDLNRIFQKFYRGDGLELRDIPGSGLGLAMASQIVEMHGGRINVKSASGKGSIFSLSLPDRKTTE